MLVAVDLIIAESKKNVHCADRREIKLKSIDDLVIIARKLYNRDDI